KEKDKKSQQHYQVVGWALQKPVDWRRANDNRELIPSYSHLNVSTRNSRSDKVSDGGGFWWMNQQMNQIVDAGRILRATLVDLVLHVNVIWGDESEFFDIFDLDHFKEVLANDVRVVSSLPSTHLMTMTRGKCPPWSSCGMWLRP
ncbi:unnamed protein product, partial [Ilex paraguariensis]